jgi:membrane-associated phospholipid phosphatase
MSTFFAAALVGWLLGVPPGAPGAFSRAGIARACDAPLSASDRQADQPASVGRLRGDRIAYRARVDVPVTVAATVAWIVAEADKTRLVSVACKWCDRAADGSDALNGFDAWGRRVFKWHNTGRAISLSNITGFGLAPAAAYGLDWVAARHDNRRSDAGVDAILITEAMAIASDVTEAMKFTIGRQRPFAHELAPGALATTPQSANNNTSFPSGHTTLAFSVVTAGAEVASLRGYRYASWIWRAGLPVAALTAYFRVAADRHYLTDVLAGAGVGTAFGFGVPYLTHRQATDPKIPVVRLAPTSRGEMVAAQWTW